MKKAIAVAIIVLFGLGGYNPDAVGSVVRVPVAELPAPQEMK
jgi:hypothetical protein